MATFTTPNWQSFRSSVDNCPISLNNSDTVKFIQQYQQQELLWNVNLPNHTNKAMRSECLMKLSHVMGLNWTEQQVKDKILSLRSRYSKELVKVRVSIAAGAEHYTPVWRFFPLLDSFLRPFCTTRKTNTPTVRAFHQRLMAASVGQPLHSSSSPIQASHATAAAPSPHFHSTSALSSSYHSNYQNAPVSNSGYQDDNDDDVQIVEEEYAGEMVQEDSVYIDDDDDDYSNESSERASARHNSAFEENTDGSLSNTKNQGYSLDGKGHSDSYAGQQERTLNQSGQGDAASQNAMTSDSLTSVRPEAQTSAHSNGTSSAKDIELTSAVDSHGNALEAEDSSQNSEGVNLKRERFATPPSPPAPPLPARHPVLSAPASFQDGDHSLAPMEAGLSSGQPSMLMNESFDEKRRDQVPSCSATNSNSTSFSREPVRKKIKQEKQETVQPQSQEYNMAQHGSGQLNNAGENHHIVRGGPINTDDRIQVNIANGDGLTTVVSSQNSNHTASKVTDVASQITNQVTNVMTSQMTNLLQTLVTKLVDKSSPGATSDCELAFVNHVVCELRKLDEDLQADVKFSIQRALHEAHKEMQQRKGNISQGQVSQGQVSQGQVSQGQVFEGQISPPKSPG